MQRSKLVLGSVVALAVFGFGAAAVALDGSTGDTAPTGDTTTTTTVVDSTTTSTTAAPTTTTLAPTTSTPDGSTVGSADGQTADGGVARSTDGCDGGTYANHGAYVSGVAHAGGDVAAAAQSDCGKPVPSVGGDTTATTEAPETDAPGTGAPNGNQGNGNGNGNGRSK